MKNLQMNRDGNVITINFLKPPHRSVEMDLNTTKKNHATQVILKAFVS